MEYDLLKFGYGLKDVGSSLSWRALDLCVKHAPLDSALVKDMEPELADWNSRLRTNILLADIFDQLASINSNLVAIGSRSRAKKPKFYPRPKQSNDGNHYGNSAVSVADLRKQAVSKRRKRRLSE